MGLRPIHRKQKKGPPRPPLCSTTTLVIHEGLPPPATAVVAQLRMLHMRPAADRTKHPNSSGSKLQSITFNWHNHRISRQIPPCARFIPAIDDRTLVGSHNRRDVGLVSYPFPLLASCRILSHCLQQLADRQLTASLRI